MKQRRQYGRKRKAHPLATLDANKQPDSDFQEIVAILTNGLARLNADAKLRAQLLEK